MIRNELLEIAIGMGCDAVIINQGFHTGKIECKDKKYCHPLYFNPTEGELIKWLYDTKGVLETHAALLNKYIQQTDNEKPSFHLKENLLSVILQVIREDKLK